MAGHGGEENLDRTRSAELESLCAIREEASAVCLWHHLRNLNLVHSESFDHH